MRDDSRQRHSDSDALLAEAEAARVPPATGPLRRPLLHRDGFPRLVLSAEQTTQLRVLETQLVEQYLDRYEDCVFARDREVDEDQWKCVRHTDGVRVYKRRVRARRASVAGAPRVSASAPSLLVVGSVEGSLEDALYGSAWRSREDRLLRAQFTKDGTVDAAVLLDVDAPSVNDPFRSLAIKWSLVHARTAGAFIKDRDFVFLAGSGIIRTRHSDERIGYELQHSLKLSAFPSIGDGTIVRAELMACSFYRQLRSGRVEVFHQAAFDAGGDLLRVLTWQRAADAFVHLARVMDCSIAKKLVRTVKWSSGRGREQHTRSPQPTDARGHGFAHGHGGVMRILSADARGTETEVAPWLPLLPEDSRCALCGQHASSSSRRACAICHHLVCTSCSVRREILPALTGRSAVSRCFCKSCLGAVVRADPSAFVVRELLEAQQSLRGLTSEQQRLKHDQEQHRQQLPLQGRHHHHQQQLSSERRATTTTRSATATSSPPPAPPSPPVRSLYPPLNPAQVAQTRHGDSRRHSLNAYDATRAMRRGRPQCATMDPESRSPSSSPPRPRRQTVAVTKHQTQHQRNPNQNQNQNQNQQDNLRQQARSPDQFGRLTTAAAARIAARLKRTAVSHAEDEIVLRSDTSSGDERKWQPRRDEREPHPEPAVTATATATATVTTRPTRARTELDRPQRTRVNAGRHNGTAMAARASTSTLARRTGSEAIALRSERSSQPHAAVAVAPPPRSLPSRMQQRPHQQEPVMDDIPPPPPPASMPRQSASAARNLALMAKQQAVVSELLRELYEVAQETAQLTDTTTTSMHAAFATRSPHDQRHSNHF